VEALMRVALYARVSKDETADDARYQDPKYQLNIMREFCRMRGWEVYGEYVDRQSGADPNRPEFKRIKVDGGRAYFNAIIVWKLDRFSREPLYVTMSYMEELKLRKVALISVTESWLDTRADNPMSEIVIAIMAWASAEERRKISDRTRAGIRQRRAIGQWRGGRPRVCRTCGRPVSGKKRPLCACEKGGPPERATGEA